MSYWTKGKYVKGRFGKSKELKNCIHRFEANGFVYGKCTKCGAKNNYYPNTPETSYMKNKGKLKSLVKLFRRVTN